MGHLVRMVDVGLRYERIWRVAVGLLATIGVLTALVFVSPATNLAAFLVAAFTIGAVCLSIGLGRDLPNADLLRTVPRGAVLGALCVLAICGYAAAVGARTVVLVLLVAGVSPPVVSWLRSGSPNGAPAWTKPAGRTRSGRGSSRAGSPWGPMNRGATSWGAGSAGSSWGPESPGSPWGDLSGDGRRPGTWPTTHAVRDPGAGSRNRATARRVAGVVTGWAGRRGSGGGCGAPGGPTRSCRRLPPCRSSCRCRST
ncbi:hypothetical protein ACXJJ3_12300 [Kribbella sp. WER1]